MHKVANYTITYIIFFFTFSFCIDNSTAVVVDRNV
jgi:hypothetical protein